MKIIRDNAPRRLFRARDGRIAGVCQGIADYLDLDVTVVRIAALVLLFCGSLGLWAYLICWIVMPIEPLNSEKNHVHQCR